MKRVLFLCSRNRRRSPTAERVFESWPGIEATSAGLAPDAEAMLTADALDGVGLVVVTERAHRARLRWRFGAQLRSARAVCLDTPDRQGVTARRNDRSARWCDREVGIAIRVATSRRSRETFHDRSSLVGASAVKRYGAAAGAFMIGGLSVAALLAPLIHKRLTARALARDVSEVIQYIEYQTDEHASPIDCWGDSLTEGKLLTPGHDFPSLLRFVFHRKVVNRGASGESSRQIEARLLSRSRPPYPENAIIWAGRNDDLRDTAAIEHNIEGMVGALNPGSHFLVLGVLNSDTVHERRSGDRYDDIVRLNRNLQRTYGGNFIPIRDLLVAQGRTNDEGDDEAVEADVVPPSLRLDALHLNDQGEAIVAYAVETAIKAHGW